jgi:hypothetical protein
MPTIERSQTSSVTLTNSERRIYCNTFEQVFPGSQTVSGTSAYYKKQWTHTPNYRNLVRSKARLPDRGFSLEEWRGDTGLINYTRITTNPCTGSTWDIRVQEVQYQKAPFLSNPGISVGVHRMTSYGCIAQLQSRARGAEFSLPIFFGEARETGRLVLGTARRLAQSYRALRAGNLPGAYRALGLSNPPRAATARFNRDNGVDAIRAASNFWLELQYGWKPLLNDAKNAAETLAESLAEPASTLGRVTSTTRSRLFTRNDTQIEVSPAGFALKEESQNESYRGVWLFEPNGLSIPASLGLLNPLSVAWELTPLSFVVDWFLPIGRYLEQLDTPYRFKHVGGTLGYKREVFTRWSQFRRDGATGSGEFSSRYLIVERSPFLSVPHLGLESIWFDPNLGAARVLSGLALARQAFR